MADMKSDPTGQGSFMYNIYPPLPHTNYLTPGGDGTNIGLSKPQNVSRYCDRDSLSRLSSFDDTPDFEPDSPIPIQDDRCSKFDRQSSIVDGLLFEIYDRWHDSHRDSVDSDTFTECSSTSEFHWRRPTYGYHVDVTGGRHAGRLHRAILEGKSPEQLHSLATELQRRVNQTNVRLVRQLKRRERRLAKNRTNCDILTAIIQASSLKRRIDTRMRFSVEPPPGESAFDQWIDAMKAVARLPRGIPDEFRKKVWLSLADRHVHELKIDWEKAVRFAFNERSNPDDNKLGLQIVKDLHRTGCSGFSGQDNEEERALLKRVLLAYARWNKNVGYCQGFNVIAALLLEVMDRKEDDALKVMIYLIDHVLPQSYFANNLRALSVDMAVFRDLLRLFYPKLSKHLDYLQHAQDQTSGGCYEPPLTNVFTMQWFLTLFATCLPKGTVLRVWDSIMLEGSEILLRTALTIWGKLASRLMTVSSADEFYTLMGDLTQDMLDGKTLDADAMIKSVYSVAAFPFPQLVELREKYTYNIRPFTPHSASGGKKTPWVGGMVLPSDEDELDDEDIEAITCFTGILNVPATAKTKGLDSEQRSYSVPDISAVGPGAYGMGPEPAGMLTGMPAYMERMTTDISALKKQYEKLRQRQTQAHIILSQTAASQSKKIKPSVPKIETPKAINHLFIGKDNLGGKNRFVAEGPRIAPVYPMAKIPNQTPSPKKSWQTGPLDIMVDTKLKYVQNQSQTDKGTVNKSPKRSVSTDNQQDKQPPAMASSPSHHTKESTEFVPQKTSPVHVPVFLPEKLSPVKSSITDSSSEKPGGFKSCVSNVEISDSTKSPKSSPSSPVKSLNIEESAEDSSSKEGNLSSGKIKLKDLAALAVPKSSSIIFSGKELSRIVDPPPEIASLPSDEDCWTTELGEADVGGEVQGSVQGQDKMDCLEGIGERGDGSNQDRVDWVEDKIGEMGDGSNSDRTTCVDARISESDDKTAKRSGGADADGNVLKDNQVEHCHIGSDEGLSVEEEDVFEGDNSQKEELSCEDENVESSDRSSRAESASFSEFSEPGDSQTNFETHKHHEMDCLPTQIGDCKERNQNINNISDESYANHPNKPFNQERTTVALKSSVSKERYENTTATVPRKCDLPTSRHHSERAVSGQTDISNITGGDSSDCPDGVVSSPDDDSHTRSFELYYSTKRSLSVDSSTCALESHLQQCKISKKPFNPFPVKHVNSNRAKTGLKLGLYKMSTLEEFEKNLKRQPVWGK